MPKKKVKKMFCIWCGSKWDYPENYKIIDTCPFCGEKIDLSYIHMHEMKNSIIDDVELLKNNDFFLESMNAILGSSNFDSIKRPLRIAIGEGLGNICSEYYKSDDGATKAYQFLREELRLDDETAFYFTRLLSFIFGWNTYRRACEYCDLENEYYYMARVLMDKRESMHAGKIMLRNSMRSMNWSAMDDYVVYFGDKKNKGISINEWIHLLEIMSDGEGHMGMAYFPLAKYYLGMAYAYGEMGMKIDLDEARSNFDGAFFAGKDAFVEVIIRNITDMDNHISISLGAGHQLNIATTSSYVNPLAKRLREFFDNNQLAYSVLTNKNTRYINNDIRMAQGMVCIVIARYFEEKGENNKAAFWYTYAADHGNKEGQTYVRTNGRTEYRKGGDRESTRSRESEENSDLFDSDAIAVLYQRYSYSSSEFDDEDPFIPKKVGIRMSSINTNDDNTHIYYSLDDFCNSAWEAIGITRDEYVDELKKLGFKNPYEEEKSSDIDDLLGINDISDIDDDILDIW